MAEMADMMHELLPRLADLTDAEWDRRDALVREERARENERALRMSRERRVSELVDAGLSDKHVRFVLGDAQRSETPALGAIDRVNSDGTWVLSGGVGAGKTMAAHTWLLREVSTSRVGFVSAHHFGRLSRYAGKIERYSAPQRLVVDDLGVEYADEKGSLQSDLDELLDARVRAGRGTLLTTNLGASDFRARYGERIASRVREGGGWLSVDGPDLRRLR